MVRRRLKRRYVLPLPEASGRASFGIEACDSSHHWSRELQELGRTGAPDTAGRRETLRQAAKERCRPSSSFSAVTQSPG